MIAIVSAAGKMRIKICNGKMVSENSNIKRVIKAAFPTNFKSFFICLCILTPIISWKNVWLEMNKSKVEIRIGDAIEFN